MDSISWLAGFIGLGIMLFFVGLATALNIAYYCDRNRLLSCMEDDLTIAGERDTARV